MTGSNLDETLPNSPQPQDGETLPLSAQPAEGQGATEPMPAARQPNQPAAEAPQEPGDLEATLPHAPARPQIESLSDEQAAAASQDAGKTSAYQPDPAYTGGQGGPPTSEMTHNGQPSKSRWGLWLLAGMVLLIATAAFSVWSGYQSGIADRQGEELTQTAASLDEQFVLAMQDLDAGRFEVARQRFDYILKINPSYPGVIDGLTQAELALNATATPTVAPTPTISPTPDTRGVDALYEQARQALDASEWTVAIDNLLALRKADPAYRSVDVDGMLYMALRNRGVDKILREADLEGGTYDLALAERFGPLDVEASNYRIWVNMYVTGASFWDIDWAQAVYYFSQLYPLAPGLRDASGWTVTDRYRIALGKYADAVAEQDDWCQAQELYESALAVGADSSIQELAAEAAQKCSPKDDQEGDSGSQNEGGSSGGEGQPTEIPAEPEPTEVPTESGPQPTPLPTNAP
jgi:tetratricopeptide (TPR) repeat protein